MSRKHQQCRQLRVHKHRTKIQRVIESNPSREANRYYEKNKAFSDMCFVVSRSNFKTGPNSRFV